MIIALALAAATLPLTPDERADIRCVAVIGVVGPMFGDKTIAAGRDYAVIVGADVMDRTHLTRDDVAGLMLAQGRDAVAKRPPPQEAADCLLRAHGRLTADAPADAPLPVPVR